jgi:hypothetical protein
VQLIVRIAYPMNETKRFSSLPSPTGVAGDNARLALQCDGRATGVFLSGDTLQYQYRCTGGYLLVTCYDYFDGVQYWFTLLSDDLRVMDVISTPDYFGFMQDIERPGQDMLSFGFFDTADRWRLAVISSGADGPPSDAGTRRPLRFFLRPRRIRLWKEDPVSAHGKVPQAIS